MRRRSDKIILKEEGRLADYIWYNRHQYLLGEVIKGEKVDPRIWKGALAAARRMEKKYGDALYEHQDDFEWGMINGKLSALRWILGEEWDMLDT